jgi:hypothetical protein
VALLALQTSLEHWRRFTTHFDGEGTAAPLRTLTKLGDSESKMSGLVDVGLAIDLDWSRPGAMALLNTWDEHYRNPHGDTQWHPSLRCRCLGRRRSSTM